MNRATQAVAKIGNQTGSPQVLVIPHVLDHAPLVNVVLIGQFSTSSFRMLVDDFIQNIRQPSTKGYQNSELPIHKKRKPHIHRHQNTLLKGLKITAVRPCHPIHLSRHRILDASRIRGDKSLECHLVEALDQFQPDFTDKVLLQHHIINRYTISSHGLQRKKHQHKRQCADEGKADTRIFHGIHQKPQVSHPLGARAGVGHHLQQRQEHRQPETVQHPHGNTQSHGNKDPVTEMPVEVGEGGEVFGDETFDLGHCVIVAVIILLTKLGGGRGAWGVGRRARELGLGICT